MSLQRARILAAIGGMALVLFFAAFISLLNDGRVVIEGHHILLTLFVGLAAYLGWPKPKSSLPGDPENPDHE